MAYAAMLSLEEFRAARRRTEMRERLHERFDRWLPQVDDRMKETQPTLEELTQAVFALRQELTQAVTVGLVEHAHRAALEQRTAVCPWCGQTLSARGSQERTIGTLVWRSGSGAPIFTVSPVSLARPRWTRRCS